MTVQQERLVNVQKALIRDIRNMIVAHKKQLRVKFEKLQQERLRFYNQFSSAEEAEEAEKANRDNDIAIVYLYDICR